MKNATLTVTFNAEKLDALEFHMSRKDTDLQEELNDTVQKLYEKYVPQATREYLDDKISREPKVRERPRRPTRAGSFFRRFHPSGGIIRYRTVQRMRRHLSPDKRSCHALAPCCPLCALVWAFVGGGGICIPLQVL